MDNDKAFEIHYQGCLGSKDKDSLLRNHKFAFSDYVKTGIKNFFYFNQCFLQLTSPQIEVNWMKWGIFVSFPDPFPKFKNMETVSAECFRFVQTISEGGMLSCLWGSPFNYIELLWETSVTSMSPNTALNQLPYELN